MLICRSYPVPENEALRLRDLELLGVWRTRPEKVYDGIVALAADMFDTPICVLSFLADRTQWFKAKVGLDADEVSREDSFCSYTIMSPDPMIVADARQDRRFRSYPAVTGPLAIRFYAGAPIASAEGRPIGTLCIADSRAHRAFGSESHACLSRLAEIVERQLRCRGGADRRSSTRHPYCADCIVSSYGRRPRTARMVDVSRGGALIELEGGDYVRGDEIIVSVGTLALSASIAWADGRAMGLSFPGTLAYDQLVRIRGGDQAWRRD